MLKLVLCSLCITLLVACSPESATETKNTELENTMMDEEMTDNGMTTDKPIDEGQAFLATNANKGGVTVTESGLQYEVITSGEGASPGPTDSVLTHYHGTFLDGKVFDSSVDRGEPISFPVNRVIAGWTEALQLMQEGDKWRLYVPPALGYGERGSGSIPGNTVLVFEVELIEVNSG
ncbi:MAG: FKBP-type peptidyl-prolyl cis-trans isomerase [Pseudomonadales bacterium]|jgi:FKBP-type peptidyl-prolyl cis-trans isomerase FklB